MNPEKPVNPVNVGPLAKWASWQNGQVGRIGRSAKLAGRQNGPFGPFFLPPRGVAKGPPLDAEKGRKYVEEVGRGEENVTNLESGLNDHGEEIHVNLWCIVVISLSIHLC